MVLQTHNFSVKQIAESGQCFRMNKITDKKYSLVAYGGYLELEDIDEIEEPEYNAVLMSCDLDEYKAIWKYYFDMDYNYRDLVTTLLYGDDEFLRIAATYGSGIRILRQEPFEALISFIISQRKSIPAIKNCIEKLCERYGEQKEWNGKTYYTFPTPDRLANARLEDLRGLGAGYRDEYIVNAARAVADGQIDLEELKRASCDEAIQTLKKLYGVGDKVASCVALFGLHHLEAFPVDVWIERVVEQHYNGCFNISKYKEYAGIVQQYMYYYIINHKEKL